MSETSTNIRIVVISGSVRPDNYTWKAVQLVVDEVRKRQVHLDVFDPRTLELQFPGLAGDSYTAQKLQQAVKDATAVVLATPEYHGSYSSVIKAVVENLGFPSVLSGKPVALLGVAAGQIGAIKALEHLRSVCSHVGAIVLPGPVSVAGVQTIFDAEGRCLDAGIEKRVRALATNLLDYIGQNICPRVALEQMVRDD